MSATIVTTHEPPAEGAGEQNQKVLAGTKPLHRFLRGQPKCVGAVMTTLGISIFLLGLPSWLASDTIYESLSSFILGALFIACGILFILSELNITKQLVTAGYALSIVSLCGISVSCIIWIECMENVQYFIYIDMERNNITEQYVAQYSAVQALTLFQSLLGGAVLIAMICFARAALKSSNTKAIVVMQNCPPAE